MHSRGLGRLQEERLEPAWERRVELTWNTREGNSERGHMGASMQIYLGPANKWMGSDELQRVTEGQ